MTVARVAGRRRRSALLCAMAGAVVAGLLAASGFASAPGSSLRQDPALKAAFLFNFVKFTEWPTLHPTAPIVACVSGDEAIAAALVDTVRGQTVSGRPLVVQRIRDIASGPMCQVLFIADTDKRRWAEHLRDLRTQPVLSVSDGAGFAQSGGIIELYVDAGRMRFAINVTAAEQAGLRLSSRLLGLARIVRGSDVK